MNARKVIKVGGSNLKTVSEIKKICQIINNYKYPPIVVVSAFYGITDKLIDGLEKIKVDEIHIKQLVNEICRLKQKYILDLIHIDEVRISVWHKIGLLLDELSEHLFFVYEKGRVIPGLRDIILSYGEKLSSVVIWGIISCTNQKCRISFPEDFGLLTDNNIGNASIDLIESKQKINRYFEKDILYVIPGFYGINHSKQVRLLGRGGTDYSAAAIAYCIDAQSLDIWKDVDGFMTCDPKHVHNPVPIPHLSYHEAAELSYFGAGILHPRTVEPLQLSNIPIQIFNIMSDDAESDPQTIIDEKINVHPEIIKSLTFENNVGILNVKGPGVGYIPGILNEITKVLSKHSINICSVITSQISINLLIKSDEADKAMGLIMNLKIPVITSISVNNNVSLIAVVGNGMNSTAGIAAKVFSAIAEENINIQLSSLGASEAVTYFLVDSKDREKAIAKLHNTLFTKHANDVFINSMEIVNN